MRIKELLESLQTDNISQQKEAFKSLESLGTSTITQLVDTVLQSSEQHLDWILAGYDYEAGEGGHRHGFNLFEDSLGTEYHYIPAITTLLIRFGEASLPELTPLLNHDRSLIRAWSAYLLGEIGSKKSVAPLLSQLQTNFSDDDSIRVIEALGKLRAQEAVDKLIELLEYRNPVVGSFAATALGGIGDVKAIPPLIDRLKRNLSVYEITAALFQFGSQVVPYLLPVLADTSAEKIHDLVLMNLYQIGDKRAIEPIIQYLDSAETPALKWSAINALGYLKAEKAVKPIADILESVTDSDLQRCAANALAVIGTKEAFEALIKSLENGTFQVRHSVALAFGQMESIENITPLLDALKDKDERIRSAIAVSLGNLQDIRAVPALTELANDKNENPSTQQFAADALRKIMANTPESK